MSENDYDPDDFTWLSENEPLVDDVQAEETILKIQEIEKSFDNLIQTCEQMIARYQGKIQGYKESCARQTNFYYGRLKDFFASRDTRKLKTKAVYRLPSGVITLKYGTQKIEHKDKELLEWLKTNGFEEYIKKVEKETVNWEGLKEHLAFVAGNAVFAGENEGMIVDGVTVTDVPDTFEFKMVD